MGKRISISLVIKKNDNIPYLSPLENIKTPDLASSVISSFCFFAADKQKINK